MAKLIRVPELGIAIANITIVEWLAKEGEQVARGQALLEVQTDKMVMEVPAEASGVLRKVFFEEDAQLSIGVPIAIIGEAGENIDALMAEADNAFQEMPQQQLQMVPSSATTAFTTTRSAASALPTGTDAVKSSGSTPTTASGRVLASPLAKRLAREKGIDIAAVPSTGRGGKVTKEDVLAYAEQKQDTIELPGTPSPPVEESDDEIEIIPFKGTRKVIADNMVRSVHTAAHYTMGVDVDCALLVTLRERLRDEFKRAHDIELTYVPFVVKAMAMAVRDHPIVNSTLRDNDLVIQKVAHVGVAIASDDFIFVPVIRRPIDKTLLQVARELSDYVRLVKENKLTPDHTYGGTITLTNLGVADLSPSVVFSIINQPEVATIAMGRIKERVVPENGEIVIRPIMGVSCTYDHRVVMGVPGGRFAEQVKFYLERPELLLAS